MEAKAEIAAESSTEPPVKRRRPGERRSATKAHEGRIRSEPQSGPSTAAAEDAGDDDDEGLEFEDVLDVPDATVQTMVRESDDDDDDDEGMDFEDVDIGSSTGPAEFKLNLTSQMAASSPRRAANRRKPMTQVEKERRLEIHKMHVLCLLSHVTRRNHWCNDKEVQDTLRPFLSEKTVKLLNPRSSLAQFGRSESFKTGISEARIVFQSKYAITERGLRRALWAESEEQLKDYELPDDLETTLDKSDFLDVAKTLQGSRDVGAQLFCALLRSAGVQARLVCSLQPLACYPGAPTMPKPNSKKTAKAPSKTEVYRAALEAHEAKVKAETSADSTSSPLRRLGHPLAAGYRVPEMLFPSPSSRTDFPTPKRIRGESPFPVYWVEVLDIAYQKWQPVDALVTRTQWKPRALEPPASDRDNCLTYAIGFEEDGSAKDVTRRYAKAYTSKTLKLRVDGLLGTKADLAHGGDPNAVSGEKWWRKVMRVYRKTYPTDVDEIEKNELAADTAREPMPKNVADFKDHPVYALERHLRRNEVLVPDAQLSGTVSAGSKAPVERIYRRRDVRIARSRDKWYRLGRVVRPDEEAVKYLPKRPRRSLLDEDDEDDDDPDKVGLFGEKAGTPIFTIDQTDPYDPPPVVNGIVPKNKFGNIDVYVPSMVPKGGAHILHERAAHAAHVLGVDYAPALTGFSFKGRQGTAVLSGVVVAEENEAAVRAVINGFADLEEELEQERKSRAALRMWSRFLKALRIRERIWANVDPAELEKQEENGESHVDKGKGIAVDDDMDIDDAPSDVSEELFMDMDDEGGGFLIE
jgi:xeroderma pigmentosum group C-complementing protein